MLWRHWSLRLRVYTCMKEGRTITFQKKKSQLTQAYPEVKSSWLKRLEPSFWGIHQWLLLETKYLTSCTSGYTWAHCRCVLTSLHEAQCHCWGDRSPPGQLMAHHQKNMWIILKISLSPSSSRQPISKGAAASYCEVVWGFPDPCKPFPAQFCAAYTDS